MCVYCYTAIGSFVGSVALAKAGGFSAVKAGLALLASHLLAFRR
jgi:hypothetical protein